MKIILDTNVFISGVFFGGPPYQILDAWRNGKFDIVLSEDIFNEYQRVVHELSKQFKEVDISTFLDDLLLYLSFQRSVDRESIIWKTWIPAQKTTGMTL